MCHFSGIIGLSYNIAGDQILYACYNFRKDNVWIWETQAD